MVERITYRPYRVHLGVGVFSLLLCLASLFLALNALPLYGLLLFALVLTFCTGVLTFILFKSYKTVVVFDAAGIYISESNSTVKNHYVGWEDLSCVYRTIKRGHGYLVLSKGVLCSNKVKEVMRRSSFTMKLVIDDCIVMPLEITKNTEQIENIIKSSVRLSKTVRGPFS